MPWWLYGSYWLSVFETFNLEKVTCIVNFLLYFEDFANVFQTVKEGIYLRLSFGIVVSQICEIFHLYCVT